MSGDESTMRGAIERELRAMTEWPGESGRLWERAISGADAGEGEGASAPSGRRAWHSRRWVVAGSGLAAAGLLLSVAIVPRLGVVRSPAPAQLGQPAAVGEDAAGYFLGRDAMRARVEESDGVRAGVEVRGFVDQATEGEAALERSLVRKATVEITTEDVRAAAMKARQLLSEPKGEYVEASDIDDSDGAAARADLVLRVEAARLEEVITQLRELGEVESEQVYGEDVTDQLVDLGARLGNERRIEKELAELLEKRPDDELEDILAVRRELGDVRERIEQLEAQQANLSRMVRLARVALMLRTDPASAGAGRGLWEGFFEDMSAALREGVETLLGTVAGLVRIAIAGAIWFALAGAALAFAWRRWRAVHPRRLTTA